MIDLKDVTFNIPVLIDTPERLENVKLAVEYLSHYFDTNIIVFEAFRKEPFYTERNPKVKYITECIEDNPFHRTRYLNEMALISETPIIVNYDCDVLFLPKSYEIARSVLLSNTDVLCGVFPYDGLFLNVPREHIKQIRETMDLSFINPTKTENFGSGSVGGALFWNKKLFIRGGMENEDFISWGCEDWERIKRFTSLGYKFARTQGALYHMSHPRGKDSSDQNPYYKANEELYKQITDMNPLQLQKYVKESDWMKKYFGQ